MKRYSVVIKKEETFVFITESDNSFSAEQKALREIDSLSPTNLKMNVSVVEMLDLIGKAKGG